MRMQRELAGEQSVRHVYLAHARIPVLQTHEALVAKAVEDLALLGVGEHLIGLRAREREQVNRRACATTLICTAPGSAAIGADVLVVLLPLRTLPRTPGQSQRRTPLPFPFWIGQVQKELGKLSARVCLRVRVLSACTSVCVCV